jgi:hypothetical protein
LKNCRPQCPNSEVEGVVTDEGDVGSAGNTGNIESDEAADKLPKLIRTKHSRCN